MTGQVIICNNGTLIGNNIILFRSHAELHPTSQVAGPAQAAQRPRIHKVRLAAVPCISTVVSFGKGVVTEIGAVEASIAIAERDGAHITGQNHRQPP